MGFQAGKAEGLECEYEENIVRNLHLTHSRKDKRSIAAATVMAKMICVCRDSEFVSGIETLRDMVRGIVKMLTDRSLPFPVVCGL